MVLVRIQKTTEMNSSDKGQKLIPGGGPQYGELLESFTAHTLSPLTNLFVWNSYEQFFFLKCLPMRLDPLSKTNGENTDTKN